MTGYTEKRDKRKQINIKTSISAKQIKIINNNGNHEDDVAQAYSISKKDKLRFIE